jgi:DNA-directed RNA polymerase subunit RPC12/RpoP
MEMNARDRSAVATYLTTARDRLRSLGALMEAEPPELGAVRGAIAVALAAVDDAQSIVADPRESGRVACPYCSYRVMSDATLCMSCWRRLDPAKAS